MDGKSLKNKCKSTVQKITLEENSNIKQFFNTHGIKKPTLSQLTSEKLKISVLSISVFILCFFLFNYLISQRFTWDLNLIQVNSIKNKLKVKYFSKNQRFILERLTRSLLRREITYEFGIFSSCSFAISSLSQSLIWQSSVNF